MIFLGSNYGFVFAVLAHFRTKTWFC